MHDCNFPLESSESCCCETHTGWLLEFGGWREPLSPKHQDMPWIQKRTSTSLACRLGNGQTSHRSLGEPPFVTSPPSTGTPLICSLLLRSFPFWSPSFCRGLGSLVSILQMAFTLQSFLIPSEGKLAHSLPLLSHLSSLLPHSASVFHLPWGLNLPCPEHTTGGMCHASCNPGFPYLPPRSLP